MRFELRNARFSQIGLTEDEKRFGTSFDYQNKKNFEFKFEDTPSNCVGLHKRISF